MANARPRSLRHDARHKGAVAAIEIRLVAQQRSGLSLRQIRQLLDGLMLTVQMLQVSPRIARPVAIFEIGIPNLLRAAQRPDMAVLDTCTLKRFGQRRLGEAPLARNGRFPDIGHETDTTFEESRKEVVQRTALVACGEDCHAREYATFDQPSVASAT
jgi:hypothetical protein